MILLKINVAKEQFTLLYKYLFVFMLCCIFEYSYACLDLPTTPPDMCIDSCVGVDDLIYLTFKDYATYGANTDEYCACALNIPGTMGTVISASIVMAGTNTPVNGWEFDIDPDSQFPPTGMGWQGLSSAVSEAIPAGLMVDIIFCIEPNCKRNLPPGRSCCEAAAGDIFEFAASGELLIGTAGATEEGRPESHISVIPVNDIIVSPVATCDDGVMNGDETGIDCGGSDCPPCPNVQCLPDLQDVLLEVDRDAHIHGNAMFDRNVAIRGNLCVMGQILNPSDLVLKENVTELDMCLDVINELKPVRYNFKQNGLNELNLPDNHQMGLLAQDVEAVLPDCVTEQTVDGVTIKTVNYLQLVPVLISSVQELNQDLEEKESEIELLKSQVNEINELKKIVANLSKKLEASN